jgi:mRNA-degrading endonuclease RelE of RelBE toxin-antitoxin system
VTWGVDFTTTARSDLVGLDSDVTSTILDTLVEWSEIGPPRSNHREIAGIRFYESAVVDGYLVAYTIDDSRRRFALLWLRERPGSAFF